MGFVMRYALWIWLVMATWGCQASLSELRPSLEEDGELYLYLQPVSQEGEGLRFSIDRIASITADGREIPLELRLRDVHPTETRRQRLLGHGLLPPGNYAGLTFKIKNAYLKGEGREVPLPLPSEVMRVDFPLSVVRKKALTVGLTFKLKGPVAGDTDFSFVFSPFIPSRPLISHVGYVSNQGSNSLAVFNKRLGQVVAVIATGRGPAGMALDQRRRRLYVALSGEDSIEVVDVQAGEILTRVRLNQGDRPQELDLTPDGKTLLTANMGSNSVSFVDPISLFELGRVTVGNGPCAVLVDPVHGRRAYIFNRLSSAVSVLDLQNRTVLTTLSTDPGPLRGALNKRGDRLYVIHELSPFLSVFNTSTLALEKRFRVGMGIDSIQVDPRNDLIYLARKHDAVIEVRDPVSFVVVDMVATEGMIRQMAIDGEENRLYVVSERQERVIASSLVSNKKVYEIDVGHAPYGIRLMGER